VTTSRSLANHRTIGEWYQRGGDGERGVRVVQLACSGSRGKGRGHLRAPQHLAEEVQGHTPLLPARPPHRYQDRLRPRAAYYHADPSNARLVWDRLPLAVAFMAFFASTLAERVHPKAAALFLPLALLGGASVVYWHLSEVHGGGDLRLYLFVQLYPLLATPVVLLLFPPRYTRGADLVAALLCYLLAKSLEALDAQVYARGGLASGHTLKHLVAGLSAAWLLYMVRKRRPVCPALCPDGGREGLR